MSEVIQGNKTIIEGKENTTSQEESRKKAYTWGKDIKSGALFKGEL